MSFNAETLNTVGRMLADVVIENATGCDDDALASAQAAHSLLGVAIANHPSLPRLTAQPLPYDEGLANGDILDEIAERLKSDAEPLFSCDRDVRTSDDGEQRP